MYPIILKLLLIKGYNNETIQATLVQHNPPDPAGFLNNYLDNEERTIAHKLGTLCVDDATFIQWTDYVARQAEVRNWSWSYWQFDSDFIVDVGWQQTIQ